MRRRSSWTERVHGQRYWVFLAGLVDRWRRLLEKKKRAAYRRPFTIRIGSGSARDGEVHRHLLPLEDDLVARDLVGELFGQRLAGHGLDVDAQQIVLFG